MIAIKDMGMPKSCDSCPFDHKYISASGNMFRRCGLNAMPIRWISDTRPQYCPLIDMSQYEDDGK